MAGKHLIFFVVAALDGFQCSAFILLKNFLQFRVAFAADI